MLPYNKTQLEIQTITKEHNKKIGSCKMKQQQKKNKKKEKKTKQQYKAKEQKYSYLVGA